MGFFEWVLLLSGLAALAITEAYTWYVSLGIALLAGSFALRAIRTRQVIPLTGLEVPWAIGLISAGFAAGWSYDSSAAWLQFARLLAACVLYYATVSTRPAGMPWLAGGFLLFAAALAVYWPTQYDFASAPTKLAFINQAGAAVQSLLPAIPGPSIHPIIAAGTLLAAIPVGLGLAWECWNQAGRSNNHSTRWKVLSLLALAFSGVVLAVLILTGSRGAWLALAGTGLVVLLAWIQMRWLPGTRQRAIYWLSFLLVGGLLVAGIVLSGNFNRLTGQVPDPTGSFQTRTVLWEQGLQLIQDTPFTGSGLMSFWMAHGGYVLQIYIPYIAHVHNSFLEVWIEQGIAGAFALLLAGIVILGWAWKAGGREHSAGGREHSAGGREHSAGGRGQVPILGWAGLAAVCAVFLHGLVDVAFYVSRTLPVIGLVIGLAWWVNALPGPVHQPAGQPSERRFLVRQAWGLLTASLVFLLLITAVVFFYQPARAAWQANLGALRQSHSELSEYEPVNFEKRSIDDIRKQASEPLLQAEASYQRALEIDPTNRTALQRLASLAFSRENYAESLSYAQALWQAGHLDPTSRLLYGEALTADGQIAQAAEVLSGVTWAEFRLMGTAWYRYWLGGDAERAANAWSVVLLLNPENQDAVKWLKEAQSKIK